MSAAPGPFRAGTRAVLATMQRITIAPPADAAPEPPPAPVTSTLDLRAALRSRFS